MKNKLLLIITSITLMVSVISVPAYADDTSLPKETETETESEAESEIECTHPKDTIIAYKDNVIDPTFSKPGSYDVVFKCGTCNTELSRYSYETPIRTVNSTVIKYLKSSKRGQLTVKFTTVETCNGFELQYCTNKSFKKASKVKLNKNKTSSTLKKLKRKKKYYIRIRAYVKENGKTYYSVWCPTKSKKIK